LPVIIWLTDPLTWGAGGSSPCCVPAGIAFCFVAWFGPRAALAVLVGRVLAVAVAWFRGTLAGSAPLALAWLDAPVAAAEALVAWELYRRARGARELADPRSAILFLLLVPGAVALTFALLRSGLYLGLAPQPGPEFALLVLGTWLGRALALASLAPPLLVSLTPPLRRRGLTSAEVVEDTPLSHRGVNATAVTPGDWVEIIGLAAGAGVLSLLLCLGPGAQVPSSWQLWGPPLLLIVWAAVRQGMLAGTLAAGAATALPLLALSGSGAAPALFLLEANLLAECAAALLVSASLTWVRLSEARYRRVVGQVPVVLYSARVGADRACPGSTVADVTLVSAASHTLLDCPPDQLLGSYERWLARVHAEDREIALAAVSQLARQRQPVSCEYRLYPVRSEGTTTDEMAGGAFDQPPSTIRHRRPERWVRDTLAPQFDSSGRLTGWEGVVVDVTEQRTLADDLRRTSTMFHALVANLPAGVVFVHGATGRPLLVNPRARQLLGHPEQVSAGVDQFPEVYRLQRRDGSPYPAEELPVTEALRHGRSATCDDLVVQRGDGRRIPLLTRAAPVTLGSQGREAAAVWVIEDLTALRQAEAAYHDSERRLRGVVEGMVEGLVILDRHGRVVVDCNQAACVLLGEVPEHLRGRPLDGLPWTCLDKDGTLLKAYERPWHGAWKTGQPVRDFLLGLAPIDCGLPTADRQPTMASASHSPHSAPDPAVRWVLVNAIPLGAGNASAGVVIMFSDATGPSDEKDRTLVETVPVMVTPADTVGHLHANPAT
jgi:PAS domain-containing protein